MSTIRVTASLVFEYDTKDGLVKTEAQAVDDVVAHLATGPSVNEYDISTIIVTEAARVRTHFVGDGCNPPHTLSISQ